MTIFNKTCKLPLFLLIAANLIILLAGCGGGGGGGGIFKSISEEEKLNKSTVPGHARGLTYCNGNLYITNGSAIFSKSANQKAGWSVIRDGYKGGIASITSNGTDVYVLTYNTDTNTPGILSKLDGTPITGYSGEIKGIFDNKIYGAGQKCFVRTSSGVYELSGSTANSPASGVPNDNPDEKINGSKITGRAVYKGKKIASTLAVGIYIDDNGWKAPPFSDQRNSGQFAGMGAYDIWVYGNTIYIAAYSSDSTRHGLWSYYGDNDNAAWNME